MKPVALLLILITWTGATASAQTTTQNSSPTLGTVLTPGKTLWITDSGGREERMRIAGISGDVVTTDTKTLRTTDIVRIRARHSDSLVNGALIGAGAAVASGLLFCRLTETWDNCRDDVGPMLGVGAIGAGVGLGIDALIRGRRTVYEPAGRTTQLRAAPIVGRRAGGLHLSVRF